MSRLTVILILSQVLLPPVWTYNPLKDSPMDLSDGNYIIKASITDNKLQQKWHVTEYINSESSLINGRISIVSVSDSSLVDVYYRDSDKDERVVIKDSDCDTFTYKNKWNKKMEGISKPLLNHVLLVGPSLIFRLVTLIWNEGYDIVTRGIKMHSVRAMIEDRLQIEYYFKTKFEENRGLRQPSRVVLIGSDPSEGTTSISENITIDIYSITTVDQDLSLGVTVKPEIGCPIYLKPSKSFRLATGSVHYIAVEDIVGPTKLSTKKEFYADEDLQILSVKSLDQPIDIIYDYELRIVYTRKDGQCTVSLMDMTAPSLPNINNNDLTIVGLLDMDHTFKYLGKIWLDSRGSIVDVWEVTSHNQVIASGKYDKVVTTFYAVYSNNSDTSSGKIPVEVAINAYNAESNGKYKLIETTRRSFYDFGQNITSTEYADRLQISDCYPKPEDRKTLAFKFTCQDKACPSISRQYYHTFHRQIRYMISRETFISASRIGDIDMDFDINNSVAAYVTFYNFPRLEAAFKRSYKTLSPDMFKGLSILTAESPEECLTLRSNMQDIFEAVAYCYSDGSCSRISKSSQMIEVNGTSKDQISCLVYDIPFSNLYRYHNEIQLEDLLSSLINHQYLRLSIYDGKTYIAYTVDRIDEVIGPSPNSKELFYEEDYDSRLVEDGTITLMASNVNSLGDCYRACTHFDEDDCETFSFCQNSKKTVCILSTSVFPNITDKRVFESDCRIYRKNHLNDYTSIKNRKFKHPVSVTIEGNAGDCAELCHTSDECFSFQSCYGQCTFGGYYTDQSTEYHEFCEIYTPKLLEKYNPSGSKIPTEVYHTELNATLDHCAALCFDQRANSDATTTDDGGNCVSFNYCPHGKTASSCNLSKYSTRDPSTRTIDSNTCTNYELLATKSSSSTKSTKKNDGTIKGTSGVAAFGIIMLFIVVGLTAGLAIPFAYHKTRSLIDDFIPFKANGPQWNRHADDNEDEDQTDSVMSRLSLQSA